MLGMPYDVIATLVAFIAGTVPFNLITQSMAPEVRRAVMKYPLALVLRLGAPLVIALTIVYVASAIILFSSPDEAFVTPTPNVTPTPTRAVSSNIDRIVVAVEAQLTMAQQNQRMQDKREPVWSATIFALALLSIFASGIGVYEYVMRDRVVFHLMQPVTKRVQRYGQLDEQALTVLVELGEQSQPGEDRQLVLVAMGKLGQQVREHPSYRGDSLEPLIAGLNNIVDTDPPGNSKNFRTAVGILQENLSVPSLTGQSSSDLYYTIRALSELCRAAMIHIEQTSEIEHLALVCAFSLQSVAELYPRATTEVSRALFEIGIAAMKKKQTLAAFIVLDKLLLLVEQNEPAGGQLVADTLGLASHFWMEGDTARKYVEEKLASTKGDLEQTWRKALEAARDHCAKTMRFETADNLDKMIAGLRKL